MADPGLWKLTGAAKNSIVEWINDGVDSDPGLIPCIKSECAMWRDGECIHISKAGKMNFCLIH
jgi:hypothetical protein